MSSSKEKVIAFLESDRSLLGGRNLYNQLPGKSLALQNSFARMTDTDVNRERLCYELAKCAGIDQRQFKILMQKPLKKAEEITVVDPIDLSTDKTKDLTAEDKLLTFDFEKPNYVDAKALVKELKLKTANKKKETLYAALKESRKQLVTAKLKELPDETKASIKLRDQFPFLREKDCPDSLKLLVNELITSYEYFKENQPRLHDQLSEVDSKEVVDVVLEEYIKNKQAWAELDHYKEKGEILGEHPLFELLAQKDEISALSTPDLTKRIRNIENRLARNRKKENKELVERDEKLLAHAEQVLKSR